MESDPVEEPKSKREQKIRHEKSQVLNNHIKPLQIFDHKPVGEMWLRMVLMVYWCSTKGVVLKV